MRSNVKTKLPPVHTHEGGAAQRVSPLAELKRTVGTCMLFENTFYERGNDIAQRIVDLVPRVKAEDIFNLAIQARTDLKLRHVPLFLAIQFLKNHPKDPRGKQLVASVIKRPDEMGEMISMLWKQKKTPLPAQMKKGLAQVFKGFNAFQLAKWDSANDKVRIRDVMFMTHPRPEGTEQINLFKMVASQTLPTPDTWETELSAGKDKKETWERLLSENKLGIMAFLMNLRNMEKVSVDKKLISSTFMKVEKKWALPFRYITANRHAPWFGKELNAGLMESIANVVPLEGSTYVIVDTSGSMQSPITGKTEVDRIDAAASLAAIVRGTVKDSRVFWFCDKWGEIPANFEGLALVDKLMHSPSGGTFIKACVEAIVARHGAPDRIIVVTDEQSWDGGPNLPKGTNGYIINVAPYQFGVENKGGWVNISGFSERVLDWIQYEENAE